jgi:hypothetical protein
VKLLSGPKPNPDTNSEDDAQQNNKKRKERKGLSIKKHQKDYSKAC